MITGYQRLAFCIDIAEGHDCLMKYGEEERIKAWHADAVGKISKAGGTEWAEGMVVVCQDKWDLEEINKFISISGYAARWVKKRLGVNPTV